MNQRLRDRGTPDDAAIRALVPTRDQSSIDDMQQLADVRQQDVVLPPLGAELRAVPFTDDDGQEALEVVPWDPVANRPVAWLIVQPRGVPGTPDVPPLLAATGDGRLRPRFDPVRTEAAVYFPAGRRFYYSRARFTLSLPPQTALLTVVTEISNGRSVTADGRGGIADLAGADLADRIRPLLATRGASDVRHIGLTVDAFRAERMSTTEINDVAMGLDRVVWSMDLGRTGRFVLNNDGTDLRAVTSAGAPLDWLRTTLNDSTGNRVAAANMQGDGGMLIPVGVRDVPAGAVWASQEWWNSFGDVVEGAPRVPGQYILGLESVGGWPTLYHGGDLRTHLRTPADLMRLRSALRDRGWRHGETILMIGNLPVIGAGTPLDGLMTALTVLFEADVFVLGGGRLGRSTTHDGVPQALDTSDSGVPVPVNRWQVFRWQPPAGRRPFLPVRFTVSNGMVL